MNDKEMQELANKIFQLLKERMKKAKKYSKGETFTFKVTKNKRSKTFHLGNRNYNNMLRGGGCSFFVAPDRMGEVHIVPLSGMSYAWELKEFENFVEQAELALEHAKKMEENAEMKDILDP